MAAWRGNGVGRIDEVTLRRARLVTGWVTVFGRANHPGQLSLLSYDGREMSTRPQCGDALRLGCKGRYDSFHMWTNVWVAGDPLTRANLSAL